jgi:hypothetical protein
VEGLALVLPPQDDAVAGGGFEAGDLAAWQRSGSQPPALSAKAHTGLGAVEMGGPDVEATLTQVISPGPALSDPTLSFMVRLAQPGPAATLHVSLANSGAFSPALTYSLAVESEGWSHAWYDLSGHLSGLAGDLSGQTGQESPLTLTLTVSGSPAILLDEVSLGSALPGGQLIYLPLTFRP